MSQSATDIETVCLSAIGDSLPGQWLSGMTIKTKCIYEPREESDGRRVLITRYYPRGVKKDRFDDWVRPLSPTRELLSAYRKGRIGWDEFAMAFVREMRSSEESRAAIRALHEASSRGKGQVVTLLCFERAHLPCHRHIVREVRRTQPSSKESRGLGQDSATD